MEHQREDANHSITENGSLPTATVDERSTLVADAQGNYSWTYEMSLFRNPVVAWTMIKILGVIVIGIATFLFLLTLGDGFQRAILLFLQFVGYGMLLMLVLLLPALAITSCVNGGCYTVQFRMNASGITHTQVQKQPKRARAMANATALFGAAAGNLTATGAGILAGLKHTSHSDFKKVRSIHPMRALHAIMVNERLERNQVYVAPDQFDFVLHYLITHCPNAKVK